MAEVQTNNPGSPEATAAAAQTAGIPPEQLSQWGEFWEKEVTAAKKWMDDFHRKGREIDRRYVGEISPMTPMNASQADQGRAYSNMFWSNVEVTLSAIFARPPKPEIDRIHLDPADDVARVACTMLQRIFEAQFQLPVTSPLLSFQDAVQDRFVPGLGQVWVRYDFQTAMQSAGMDMFGQPLPDVEVVTDEQSTLEYVNWADFLMSPARRWPEVRWCARRHFMPKGDIEKKWGAAIASQVPLTAKSTRNGYMDTVDPIKASPNDQGVIWEIWSKTHQKVFWKADGLGMVLDVKDNPLKLREFFPCPQPLTSTKTTSSMLPVSDYLIAGNQYRELEMLAQRMTVLSEAIRVVGVYDETAKSLQGLLQRAAENQMIPVDNWAMFAEKGGIKGQIDWFPIDMVVAALEKLTERRRVVIQELYETLGISDLMRGSSVASETATAQQLKAQFGGARVSKTQNGLSGFMTSAMWLVLEVISRHWEVETIIRVSQIMQTPDAQLAQQAAMMIKNDPTLVYRIKVSTDSIESPNWAEEKQQRTEFLQAISQFIGMSMPLVQSSPGTAVFLVQVLQWAAAGFKGGSQIESVLDQALQSLMQQIKAPKPPKPPTPQELKDLSAADQNTSASIKDRMEAAGKAAEVGLPPQLVLMRPAPSQEFQQRQQGQQSGQPPMQGQPPRPPMAPPQAGPIPPRSA